MANKAVASRMQDAAKFSAFAPNISPFFGLLPPELWDAEKDFFIYGVDYNTISTAGTSTGNIAIQADSHFLIVAGTMAIQSTAGSTAAGSFPGTMDILDAGSGRKLNNIPMHVANYFGTAQNPAYWPFPKFIHAGSTLSLTLVNLDAAASYIVRVALWGLKIFGF